MDLRAHLTSRNLKWNWESISNHCIENPAEIDQIIDYCIDSEVIIQQNAGAVLGKIVDLDKTILLPYQRKMLQNLKTNPHDAVKRATMRVFQFSDIDENLEGEIFEVAMKFVTDSETAIAIKAFSITVARRICEKYPELAKELIPIVEILVEQKLSSGITNRGQKELTILYKLSSKI